MQQNCQEMMEYGERKWEKSSNEKQGRERERIEWKRKKDKKKGKKKDRKVNKHRESTRKWSSVKQEERRKTYETVNM